MGCADIATSHKGPIFRLLLMPFQVIQGKTRKSSEAPSFRREAGLSLKDLVGRHGWSQIGETMPTRSWKLILQHIKAWLLDGSEMKPESAFWSPSPLHQTCSPGRRTDNFQKQDKQNHAKGHHHICSSEVATVCSKQNYMEQINDAV